MVLVQAERRDVAGCRDQVKGEAVQRGSGALAYHTLLWFAALLAAFALCSGVQ